MNALAHRILIYLVLAVSFFYSKSSWATHVRAADIKVEPACGSPFTFTITVIAYLNTQSNTRFGTNSEVLFGDGTSERIPITVATLRPDLGLYIAVATFTTTHTYSNYGTYTVSYIERDRSSGILNIANSHDVAYTTFVTHTIDQKNICNHYPELTVPPLDRACFGVAFFHTPGAYDVDGDSLSYELTIPKSDPSTFADYTSPNSSRFYTKFSTGNEDLTGPPIFNINSVNGLLTWDAPGMQGEYNIAFNIVEWRKDSISGQYQKLSTTTRDMQIVVEECHNIRPELKVPVDLCVETGTVIDEIIFGMDAENHPVKIEVYSEILDFKDGKNKGSHSPSPASYQPSKPPFELRMEWTTDCRHVRQQPYQIVFKITDDPPDGPKLVNFKVWNIKVVAPAPVWGKTTLDLVSRYTDLEWSSYACPNADKIQVWRKVDSYDYQPDACETGLPKFLGYSLIAEVNSTETRYMDTNNGKGLFVGAKYCYRIMAYFNSPASTPSQVSVEKCVSPIEADAPVITHVSVENTAVDNGKIRVSWRSPFGINATQFPKPYQYEVYRALGFVGETSLVKVGRVQDTSFVDSGINSKDKVFNYRIVLYSKPQNANSVVPIDTSAIASSERLSFEPGIKQIALNWRDSVPWSNVVQSHPYHLIYRGIENIDENKMTLIDSVNVAENGFSYLDDGRYKNEPLQDDKRYSYRILTRGTYGNPKIFLQQNFSQVITTYPLNNLLPCEQTVHINSITCEEYWNNSNCDQKEFSNIISWGLKDLSGCRRDIGAYNIYSAALPDSEYLLLAANVTDTVYTDKGLQSYARCYKVSAVDYLGVEGPASDAICNDNCPYYDLPNVFTPNEDGYNDSFNANFDRFLDGKISIDEPIRCPRFVRNVSIKIYNRWGNEVYHFQSNNLESIAIEWDGKDIQGKELEAGVYFFSAYVTFDVMDPNQQTRELKGWVHLIR
ncbi:MAG: gliding motility-associated C-terminal domain-containing protein [Bacteroidia bacterium]|nr:gliding motility-associated C-terminal domain-containing protein [Bacteroidia bacterium]